MLTREGVIGQKEGGRTTDYCRYSIFIWNTTEEKSESRAHEQDIKEVIPERSDKFEE